jgi:hypothetical protein
MMAKQLMNAVFLTGLGALAMAGNSLISTLGSRAAAADNAQRNTPVQRQDTPSPEPAILALTGGGMIALGAIGRKKLFRVR